MARTDAKRMTRPEDARAMAALIEKRLAQGLTITVIAARLGIPAGSVPKIMQRGAKLAAAGEAR